jgi:hypothetical protein
MAMRWRTPARGTDVEQAHATAYPMSRRPREACVSTAHGIGMPTHTNRRH